MNKVARACEAAALTVKFTMGRRGAVGRVVAFRLCFGTQNLEIGPLEP
jgi:hypothetical protein